MAHEILSVKLCELENQLSRLSGRIHLSETADHTQLQQEIQALRRECDEMELTLQAKLRYSRSRMVSVLADSYRNAEAAIQNARTTLQTQAEGTLPDEAVEKKILLAEYTLDFAIQASNRALLLAMQAIDAQLTQQGTERRPS